MASMIGILEIMVPVIISCFFLVILRGFRKNYDRDHLLPRKWPFLGMLPQLLLQVHRIHDWFTEILEKNHCTFLFTGPNMQWLITADPSNIHYIMSSNFSNFPKGPEFKEIFDLLGDGIFNADSHMWKSQRKLTRDLISHRQFYKFLVKITQEKVENGFIPVLEHVSQQGLVVDLQDLFQRFTFDATCMIVTGHDPGCLSTSFPEVAFSKAMDEAEEAIFYRHIVPGSIWKLQRWLNIGEERKLRRAWQTLDGVISEIVSAKKEEMAGKLCIQNKELDINGQGIDLLTAYMMEDGVKIMGSKSNDKFLRDVVINLMLAGRDTTSSALSWFFWLLSKNPLVERKILEELKASTTAHEAGKWRLFEVEVLKNLAYLHGALCESLRLYPPVPFQHKSPLRPDILPSGHRVDPETRIMFSLYTMGRMSSIWGEDCLEFKPERWITGRGGIKHEPSYKFLAFNAGPRSCLGKEIAFVQMMAVAAAIIYNYSVQVVEGQTFTPSLSIILHMKHGMKVKLFKRPSY